MGIAKYSPCLVYLVLVKERSLGTTAGIWEVVLSIQSHDTFPGSPSVQVNKVRVVKPQTLQKP